MLYILSLIANEFKHFAENTHLLRLSWSVSCACECCDSTFKLSTPDQITLLCFVLKQIQSQYYRVVHGEAG